ncbi:unnamed protein product [Clonostachys byssicola]|uniref:Septation protein imp2 n=1 Tax=Clonostachys byssicola TaxID=160290 RepID=A0A9N9UTW8_9HYPO|nr:unnamed protein product [Clonostachys byssicola]
MPGATAVEVPAVAMSFANNFWGKDDAGVGPLLERMHGAKQTCDELKAFYSTRASIEEEYARKLLNLSRKALGSQEAGTLKNSLDTVRGEVESMAKQHQNIAAQMKSELEEPLAAFAGGMKERRKIVQNTVEKLLKTKVQQTQHVNKTRDKYEQECLKIKGYLAQGHMVMGQEERRNKAKLEKTQISVATSNTEYEAAVKVLEETTTRWNREWKAAADKFQDLEEERLDFTKSSLWTFANLSSTVCVSDDASCEKVRLSLEIMEVEKDIISFITEKGTGQEIPDAPKYINFCRGDVADSQSEISEDDRFSVAQFPRSINPAFRSSSPQPSTFESHHDPNSALANNLAHRDVGSANSRESLTKPQRQAPERQSMEEVYRQQPPVSHRPPPSVRQSSEETYEHQKVQASHRRPPPTRQPVEEPYHQRQLSLSYQRQPHQGRQSMEETYQHQVSAPQQRQAPPTRQSMDETYDHQLSASQQRHPAPPRQSMEETYRHQVSVPQQRQPPPVRQSMEETYEHQVSASQQRHPGPPRQSMEETYQQQMSTPQRQAPAGRQSMEETYQQAQQVSYDVNQHGPVAEVPHDPYPMDGMTMLCRTGPPSDLSSQVTSNRPSSKDEASDYATSFSSVEPPSGKTSPTKQDPPPEASPEKRVFKKKSGFFQNHSPFRRKSVKEAQNPVQSNRNTWHASSFQKTESPRRPQLFSRGSTQSKNLLQDRTASPEPIDANASVALGVGQNVLPVTRPETNKRHEAEPAKPEVDENDPIAMALAELKGVTLGKQSSVRMSADHYHGIATPAPGPNASMSHSVPAPGSRDTAAVNRGTPPPSYQPGQTQPSRAQPAPAQTAQPARAQPAPAPSVRAQPTPAPSVRAQPAPAPSVRAQPAPAPSVRAQPAPAPSVRAQPAPAPSVRAQPAPAPSVRAQPTQTQAVPPSRLGVPPPAVTSKAMRAATQKATTQTRSVFSEGRVDPGAASTSPVSRPGTRGTDVPRAVSPIPARSASPQPQMANNTGSRRADPRSASPNPHESHQYHSPQQQRRDSSYGIPASPRGRPSEQYHRQSSPHGSMRGSVRGASPAPQREYQRPMSSYSYAGSDMAVQLAPAGDDPYGSQRSRGSSRPSSRAMGLYNGDTRQRSKSVADPSRLYTPDGRPILHYARAMYMYQAAIPEELGFAKGDYLAVLRHQDDGWWEAEVHNGNGRIGLVPSNYLQPC